MKKENRLWGPKRIHGKLIKLGIEVAKSTVRNVLRKVRLDHWSGKPSENWRDFFKRHQNVWAIDYFTVHSATFRRMFVLVIMDIRSRTLIATHSTRHPTARWAETALRRQIVTAERPPKGIVHDRDPSFESKAFRDLLKEQDVHNLRCPRRTPIANAFVERLQGTIQRECTDHFLFFNELQLQRTLREFRDYYNHSRPHQGLNQRPPVPPPNLAAHPGPLFRPRPRPILDGLHHDYLNAAA